MRTRHNKTGRLLFPALLGATVAMVAAGAVNLVSAAVMGNAKVGDIIAFEPSHDIPLDVEARIVVHRPDQFGCVLDLNTIRQAGGSLVIEAQLSSEGNSFRLHWAGERTASNSGDCGQSADLILDRADLDNLVQAAGGFGVARRQVHFFAAANRPEHEPLY